MDFLLDMEQNIRQFPFTHTKHSEIDKVVKQHEGDPPGRKFGVAVAADCEDKAYGFEIDSVEGNVTRIQYVGIWET